MTTITVDENTERASVSWPRAVRLSAAGVAVVLALPRDTLPTVLHWGPDPGELSTGELDALVRASRPPLATNGIDDGYAVSIVPEGWTGWPGTPGLVGHRSGRAWSPKFVPTVIDIAHDDSAGGFVEVTAVDPDAELELRVVMELLPSGLLRTRAGVTNLTDTPYTVDGLMLGLPVPTRAGTVTDMAGRWANERVPQSRPFTVGTHLREGRHGRTGADAATLLTAGTDDLDFDRGEGWGIHLAFSGNHRVLAERVYSGERVLMGGELLLPGEIELARGERYETPHLYASYGTGLDAIAARFHAHLRGRPHHPNSPRPVVMNVWEAVYFDHSLDRLVILADLAAEVGVERFVLDDGWFGDRRGDSAGLGDWVLAEEVWGDGRFQDLVDAVKSRGMQFGLWFEPEMVNLDSDLGRAHPDWLMQVPGRLPVTARHQQVLDLTHPGAFEHVYSQIVTLVREYGIDFIKWDHNRDLVDAGSTRSGRAGVHDQTLATYRLLDAIRRACPDLEVESCSSGGSRVDLGILEHTDRVWASDCIDARERQQIQRWTAQLLPPELVGSHIGAERAHTTGRRLDLDFRAMTALFGHFGIEWDLEQASPADRSRLAEWVEYYTVVRELIHTGTTVRRSLEDGALWLHGAVSPDRGEALYLVSLRERPPTWPVGRVRLPGLDRSRIYMVAAAGPSQGEFDPTRHPAWWSSEVRLSGAVLADVGIEIPALDPDHGVLLSAVAQP